MSQDAHQYWEGRYQEKEAMWSGRPNAVLVTEAGALPAGRALDLGCGEGADAIWLAHQGWQVTGVDISTTALARAETIAEAEHVSDRVQWVQANLAQWQPDERYDLVSAFFLNSPVDFPREQVMRRAAAAVAPGGVLLSVGHAQFPPWAEHTHDDGGGHDPFPTVEQEVADLGLDQPGWELLVAEDRARQATSPEGEAVELIDAVVLARRIGR